MSAAMMGEIGVIVIIIGAAISYFVTYLLLSNKNIDATSDTNIFKLSKK